MYGVCVCGGGDDTYKWQNHAAAAHVKPAAFPVDNSQQFSTPTIWLCMCPQLHWCLPSDYCSTGAPHQTAMHEGVPSCSNMCTVDTTHSSRWSQRGRQAPGQACSSQGQLVAASVCDTSYSSYTSTCCLTSMPSSPQQARHALHAACTHASGHTLRLAGKAYNDMLSQRHSHRQVAQA